MNNSDDQFRDENLNEEPQSFDGVSFKPTDASSEQVEEQSGEQVWNKPKKESRRKGRGAGLLALCIVCSLLCGGLGGYFGAKLGGGTDGAAVIYQSVQRLDAEGVPLGSTSLSTSDVVNLTKDSVVEITTEVTANDIFMMQYVKSGAGSGVIFTADGYIVTNNHVISGAKSISVTTTDGKSYPATLIGTDAESDIAVIKIDATGLTPAVLGSSGELTVGSSIIVIGNPLGQLGGTVTTGIISALDRAITIDGQSMNLMQTNAAVNPGNSGGGMYNMKGELVGIVNAKSSGTDVEGLGFAIPIDSVKATIEQLITYGYVQGRVQLGVTMIDIDDARTAASYRVNLFGVYIISVSENSDAERAGLLAGDCIISIDDKEIETSADAQECIKSHSVGDVLKIVVARDNKYVTLSATLTEYVPSK